MMQGSIDFNQVNCKQCGNSRMRRLPRHGFLQRHVYNALGYYPWECPVCRKAQYFRLRGKRELRKEEWDDSAAKEIRVGD